ncbi:hypothetical protein [Cohnella luojiensis]|uniref:Uncharacterized protein n=1 Tax=Cohnella luojiensis TaxID=652876 RepID=A0A4Y8M5B0_9BACL|nr:hypothetical protein [Cohnella luojiensis]TFE29962.1 hypothetical protein E2980_04185 [Cohnella luojiensis]
MKIGSFVMGGLAGAAVVMMIQRNQMMSAVAASVGHNLKHRMNDMKVDAIEKALNMKFASSFKRATDSVSHKVQNSSSHGGGLDEIEKIVAQDPSVSHEVNAILEQNGQQRI